MRNHLYAHRFHNIIVYWYIVVLVTQFSGVILIGLDKTKEAKDKGATIECVCQRDCTSSYWPKGQSLGVVGLCQSLKGHKCTNYAQWLVKLVKHV
jgi:hypothetical protein